MKKCKRTISVSVHKRVMTPREAILRIKSHMEIHKLSEPNAIYITEALNMAMQALEKQIPKKLSKDDVSGNYFEHIEYRCSNCKCRLISRLDGEWLVGRKHKYCPLCGQALDWSDEE